MVEHLPSTRKALEWIPNTKKEGKKEEKKRKKGRDGERQKKYRQRQRKLETNPWLD